MRSVLGVVAAALVIGGCSSGGDSDPDAVAPSPRTPTSEPATQTDAGAALEQALKGFAADGQGSYTSNLTIAGSLAIRQEGTYDIQKQAGHVRATVGDESGTELVIETISTRGGSWMRLLEGGAKWPCWVHIGPGASGSDLGPAFEGMTAAGPPTPVVTLFYSVGNSWSGSDIAGTTDLAVAAASMSGKFMGGLGIPPNSDERVAATFELAGGRLVGWSTTVLDIAEAALDAGYEPLAELKLPDDPEEREAVFSDAVFEVTIDQGADVERIAPLASSDVIDMLPKESFEKRMRACG